VPVIDHLIGRMERVAAARDIVVVTRADKQDVIAHALAGGHEVHLGEPPNVAASLLLGLEHARSRDPEGIAGSVVIAGFPDTLFSPEDAFALLVTELKRSAPPVDLVLGLFESDEPQRGDVVDLDTHGLVRSVTPKPADPTTNLVWGLFAARTSALEGLTGVSEPGDHFSQLAREGRVRGVRLGSDYVDIGVPETLKRFAPGVFDQRAAELDSPGRDDTA
jgi:dTDP-glucose pyrophosphorylase